MYTEAEQRLEQQAPISGGTTAVNANKPGAYLVLRTTPSRPPVQNLILRADLSSQSDEGIGLVFRYRDADNFCFFLMNQAKGYRLLARGPTQLSALSPKLRCHRNSVTETPGFVVLPRSPRSCADQLVDDAGAFVDELLAGDPDVPAVDPLAHLCEPRRAHAVRADVIFV